MCRNIRTLFNLDPPAADEELRDAALQFVRKITGYNKPSRVNESAFNAAVEEITRTSRYLIDSLETNAPQRDREELAENARRRASRRASH